MSVEVVNRDGRWFVNEDGQRREFPDRDQAIEVAKNLAPGEAIPVIHERSAHVKAEIFTKGN